MITDWKMDLGANFLFDGRVRFLVWAPDAASIKLKLINSDVQIVDMHPLPHGYYEAILEGVLNETDYFYLINGEVERPDPASRCQPKGVHGPSRVINPGTYVWNDHEWKNRPLEDYIIYELHIGTFTKEGSFYSAIEKLPHLRSLGVTAIEIMPVSSFPGEHNWGYDGVFPYAPQEVYGGYCGLKEFIDACHQMGLAVIMDVVYNHFGPEGNYLKTYAQVYFTDKYHTPWGDAINYDGNDAEQVRKYFIDNALYWKNEFHIDALRLDAVHVIFDAGSYPILEEMHDRLIDNHNSTGKNCYLIAESDLNDPTIIKSKQEGGYGLDAQWNDDFHHAIQSYFILKRDAYFQDFGTLADIIKSLKEGYVYDGRWSAFRKKRHGHSSKGIPGIKFVNFLQNHDQIANASQGHRISTLMTEAQHRLAALLLFFSPGIPLIFMGQEWGEELPFYFFTSFGDADLQKAVSEGRKNEYAAWNIVANFVDPTSEEAFLSSCLNWRWTCVERQQRMFMFYQNIIQLRKSNLCLSNGRSDLIEVEYSEDERWMLFKRGDPNASPLLLVCNFSDENSIINIRQDFFEVQECVLNTSQITPTEPTQYAPWTAKIFNARS